jgi:hypothetical protein
MPGRQPLLPAWLVQHFHRASSSRKVSQRQTGMTRSRMKHSDLRIWQFRVTYGPGDWLVASEFSISSCVGRRTTRGRTREVKCEAASSSRAGDGFLSLIRSRDREDQSTVSSVDK